MCLWCGCVFCVCVHECILVPVCMLVYVHTCLCNQCMWCVYPSVLGQCIFKCPFLQALYPIRPVGGGHATVGVQKDPETPDYEQAQDQQQHPYEGKCCLLLRQDQGVEKHFTVTHSSRGVVIVEATHGWCSLAPNWRKRTETGGTTWTFPMRNACFCFPFCYSVH